MALSSLSVVLSCSIKEASKALLITCSLSCSFTETESRPARIDKARINNPPTIPALAQARRWRRRFSLSVRLISRSALSRSFRPRMPFFPFQTTSRSLSLRRSFLNSSSSPALSRSGFFTSRMRVERCPSLSERSYSLRTTGARVSCGRLVYPRPSSLSRKISGLLSFLTSVSTKPGGYSYSSSSSRCW